jgi:hypothetical protein
MRYQHLPLAEVKPGMILSDLLRDGHGAVLLAAGTTLTASMLHRLALHGIDSLPILRDGGGGNESDEQAPGAVTARLAHVFRHNDPDNHDDWATGILRRYVEDYRLGRGVPA